MTKYRITYWKHIPISLRIEEGGQRGDWIECDGSLEEVAETLLSELEAEFAKIEFPKQNGYPVR